MVFNKPIIGIWNRWAIVDLSPDFFGGFAKASPTIISTVRNYEGIA